MTHNPETVERVAKAAAFSIRQPNDVSADADEYWQHTGESARHTWIVAIAAALSALPPQEVSVQEAAKVLLAACPSPIFDKLKGPLIGEFSQKFPFFNEYGEEVHADVNISWVVMKKIIAAALRALSEDTQ